MKQIFRVLIAIIAITFTACNSRDESSKENDNSKMDADTTKNAVADTTHIAQVTPTFSNLDTKLTTSLNTIVDHYLDIKNALVKNDGDEAASGAKAMGKAISGLDKSLLAADQKKAYDDIEEDLKEHAEHIGKNGDNIKHQREHFSMMSEDVYDLVRAFGGRQALYHFHCPMYNKDNGGAMWLSETKEVRNPYFGSEMPKCGSLEEVIK
jgi:hypothetical protein